MMTHRSRLIALALAVVATLQTGLLLKIVYDRHMLIKSGREIVLPVVPVDPRDLMRGDYVVLGYQAGLLHRSELAGGDSVAKLARDEPIYVTLRADPGTGWKPVAVSAVYPADVAPGDLVLKGRVNYNYDYGQRTGASQQPANSFDLSVRYGIESYFVPEGEGKPIELSIRDQKVEAIVAVGAHGDAALKGLMVGGERHEDPPIL